MSLILNIDTAVQTASVCLAQNGTILGFKSNPSQKDSASWLQPAIKEVVHECNVSLQNVKAVAVSYGPGSYTGLRVGMSAAKGLCYALNLPLITLSTLKTMAFSALPTTTALLCPMIDARRAEVFTAVYDGNLKETMSPTNMILNESSFQELLERHTITFFGNGSVKFKEMISHPNAFFQTIETSAKNMVLLSLEAYHNHDFADLAYSEPFYGKDFHSITVN